MNRTVRIVFSAGTAPFALALALAAWSEPCRAHPDIEWQIGQLTARIEANPSDAALVLQRGELHRIHQDWAAAEADYLLARRLDPQLQVVRFYLGRMKLEAGELDVARRELDAFLKQEPDHPAARLARARVLARLDRPLEAAADYDRAIATEPRPQPGDYLERARTLASAGEGQLSRALRGLDEGIAALGGPVTLQLYAIDLELVRGRPDAALARLDRLAAASPRPETWLLRRAEILEQAGRPQEARSTYGRALEAIDALPAARRWSRAMVRLREEALGGVERLGAEPAP